MGSTTSRDDITPDGVDVVITRVTSTADDIKNVLKRLTSNRYGPWNLLLTPRKWKGCCNRGLSLVADINTHSHEKLTGLPIEPSSMFNLIILFLGKVYIELGGSKLVVF